MNPSEQRPTPETDAATFEAVVGCYPDGSTATESVVDSNITRKLERERDEARKHLRDANRGAQVNARINQSMAGKLNEARQQLEAMREAIGVAYAALLEAHDRSKPENQNGASLFHVHQKAKKALAKLQPFLKP